MDFAAAENARGPQAASSVGLCSLQIDSLTSVSVDASLEYCYKLDQ